MASWLERQSDRMAVRSTRRGLLGAAAKVTAAVGAVGLGLARVQDALACTCGCCNLTQLCFCSNCPYCPSCPPDGDSYIWYCVGANGRDTFRCTECYCYGEQYAKSCSCCALLPIIPRPPAAA